MRRKGLAVVVLLLALASVGCGGEEEQAAAGENALTLTLAEQKGSGQSGSATLTAVGDAKARIVVELLNPPGPAQPSHVHSGTCDEIGAVVLPLESLQEGRAETVVPMSLDELRRGRLIVHAHKSEAESKVSVACAEIPKAATSMDYGY